MTFSKHVLTVFQQLLAAQRVSVLDQNADQSYISLQQARQELLAAIQEVNASQPS